jgi:hypothetical protein
MAPIMAPSWHHLGTIMAPIMAPSWHHHGTDLGTIMAPSWHRSRHHHGTIMAPIMAPSWHHHGTIMAQFYFEFRVSYRLHMCYLNINENDFLLVIEHLNCTQISLQVYSSTNYTASVNLTQYFTDMK